MDDGDRQILNHFAQVRGRTRELLRRVPDDWLGRTAPGEERPLGWLFLHLADGVDWWMHNVMKDGRGVAPKYKNDKTSILEALAVSGERLVSFLSAADGARLGRTFSLTEADGSTESWVARDRVLYLAAHEIHHRGKIVLALRQWGFTDIPSLL